MTTNDRFKELWGRGIPAKEIAAQLGLSSEHYVYTRARALTCPRRQPKGNPLYRRMESVADDIVYAIEEGLSVAQIADELGVSRGYPYKLYRDVT